MANTLTNLAPDMFMALDTVSRELTGFIASVRTDMNFSRVGLNNTVRSFAAPASTAADITASQNAPNTGDQTITNKTITISKSRAVPIRWNGEEEMDMNTGPGHSNIFQDQMAQAFRTLVNEVEADLASQYVKTARAYGTAGTTPFASTLIDTANIRKILVDNGAPTSDMQCVIDTTAGASMRKLTQLTKANEAADSSLLRTGEFSNIHGVTVSESGEIDSHTKGTGTSYTSDTAGYAIGATAITLITGSGTVVAGDAVTFAGDTNKYIVTTGVAAPGVITLAEPGLRVALAASAVAMTIGANFTANMAFDRNAIVLATRLPAAPAAGDAATDFQIVSDPRTGLSFEVRLYPEHRQNHYSVGLAWGYQVIKPEHTAILLG